MALTPKQERFAQEYVRTGNASEAYRRAYNVRPGTREATTNNDASSLTRHPEIAARVSELLAPAARRASATAADIAAEAWKIATDPAMKGSTRVAALALLARQFAQFNERRVEVSVTGGIDVRAVMALRQELEQLAAGEPVTIDQLSKPLVIEGGEDVMTTVDSAIDITPPEFSD